MTVGCIDSGKVFSPLVSFSKHFRDWQSNCTFMPATVAVMPRPVATTTGPVPVMLTNFTRDTTGEADPLGLLVALAEQGDGPAFARQAAEIAWDVYPPQDIARAVRLALAAGAPLTARQLSVEGYHLYPEDAELAKMAHILAPPKVLGTSPANPSRRLDQEWLRHHAHEYRGQWIALKDGALVAAAPTAKQLKSLVPEMNSILVTRVA